LRSLSRGLAAVAAAATVVFSLSMSWILGHRASGAPSVALLAVQGGVVGAVATIFSVAYVRMRVIGPLAMLTEALASVSDGKADLTTEVAIASRDELGSLCERYSSFMANLNEIVCALKTMVDASTEIGDNVEAATVKAAGLSRDVGRSIQENKNMSASLDAEIEKSRAGVRGAKASFDEVVGLLMESQAASVSESTAAVEEMVASIGSISSVADAKKRQSDEILRLVESGSADMQESLGSIRTVVKSAERLMDIVRLIEEIAQRVDLIAMNAAIEAAHAAQAGRGFAVVADEIRKLAEATNGQAKTIADHLKSMIGEMHDAERATEKTDASMRKVIGSVVGVADGMREIAGGVGELSAGSAEILQAMQSLVDVTQRVRSASGEANEGIASVDAAIANIAGLSEKSLCNAERMESAVTEIDDSFDGLLAQGKSNVEQIAGIDGSISRFRTKRKGSAFIIGYNDVPPFCMTGDDGRPSGATNDFLAAILGEMGIKSIEFKHIQSLERIYELLDRNAIDAYTLANSEYSPNPELKYRVPAKPTFSGSPGLVMRKAAALDRVKGPSDLSGLRIVTKIGMPLTKTMKSAGVSIEYLGGAEPLVEGVRLVSQGRADGVYAMIATELLFMARGLGVQDAVKTVPLSDAAVEMFTAFSVRAAGEYMAVYDEAHERVRTASPFARFLDPYLGSGPLA
jgi:methyl-accepting chemotaxis protein